MTEREVDQLLEAAIASYLAEPAPGLAQRVRVKPPLRWLPYAAAVAALLLAAVWLPRPGELPPPPPFAAKTPAVPVVPLVHVVIEQPAPQKIVPKPLPPQVMSEPERQLARFVQAYPALAQQVLVDAPGQWNEPLTTEPLVIAPLESFSEARSGVFP